MAVVKANAYGHGAVDGRGAGPAGVTRLAVASVDEGIALRQAGIKATFSCWAPFSRAHIQTSLAPVDTGHQRTVCSRLAKEPKPRTSPYPFISRSIPAWDVSDSRRPNC